MKKIIIVSSILLFDCITFYSHATPKAEPLVRNEIQYDHLRCGKERASNTKRGKLCRQLQVQILTALHTQRSQKGTLKGNYSRQSRPTRDLIAPFPSQR